MVTCYSVRDVVEESEHDLRQLDYLINAAERQWRDCNEGRRRVKEARELVVRLRFRLMDLERLVQEMKA